jgi:hypothetical protein
MEMEGSSGFQVFVLNSGLRSNVTESQSADTTHKDGSLELCFSSQRRLAVVRARRKAVLYVFSFREANPIGSYGGLIRLLRT